MPKHHPIITLSEKRSAWHSLLLLFLFVFIGIVVGQLFATLAVAHASLGAIISLSPQAQLLIMQALIASSAFIAAPIYRLYNRDFVCKIIFYIDTNPNVGRKP